MKSIIGRYRELTGEASARERSGELLHAAKLWRLAAENARGRHSTTEMEFCQRRAEFCDRALWRQNQTGGAAKGRS